MARAKLAPRAIAASSFFILLSFSYLFPIGRLFGVSAKALPQRACFPAKTGSRRGTRYLAFGAVASGVKAVGRLQIRPDRHHDALAGHIGVKGPKAGAGAILNGPA